MRTFFFFVMVGRDSIRFLVQGFIFFQIKRRFEKRLAYMIQSTLRLVLHEDDSRKGPDRARDRCRPKHVAENPRHLDPVLLRHIPNEKIRRVSDVSVGSKNTAPAVIAFKTPAFDPISSSVSPPARLKKSKYVGELSTTDERTPVAQKY